MHKVTIVKHTDQIDSLIQRFPCISGLKDKEIWEYDLDVVRDYFYGRRKDAPQNMKYRWKVPKQSFFGYQTQICALPVMFIGKTGYGKSSLLNHIIGKSVFLTDDTRPCTQNVESAFFRLGSDPKYYLALFDFPGIGESEQADHKYMTWYADMVKDSPCIVYVLRADQRDYSIDERAFEKLFSEEILDNVIIALNCADKIEPVNRKGEITEAQKEALEEKCDSIESILSVPSYRIFPCSAHTGYGMEELVSCIEDQLELCVYDKD